MMKTVFMAYTTAQGLILLFVAAMQGVSSDIIEAVEESNEVVSLFSFDHLALGLLGQVIYVIMTEYNKANRRENGEDVKLWSNNQTVMLVSRLFLAAIGSTIVGMIFTQLGDKQTLINMPPAPGLLGVYLTDMAVGYFIIKIMVSAERKGEDKIKNIFK